MIKAPRGGVKGWGRSFAGVRSPPLRGASQGEMAFRRKARGSRDGRFSRRDTLCASAWQGRTDAKAFGSAPMRSRTGRAWRGYASVRRGPSFTGVRSPPLRGASQGEMALRREPGDDARGGFLGGTRSARPRGNAGRKPGRLMITDGRAKGWWPKRDNISVGVMSTLRACGARPSAKPGPGQGEPAASKGDASVRRNADITGVRSPPLRGASQGEMALRREPGDDARGGFLGGTHSVRPRGKAVLMPRHFVSTGCVRGRPGP